MNISLIEFSVSYVITKHISLKQLQNQDSTELFQLIDSNKNYLRKWLPWLDSSFKEVDSLNFIIQSSQNIINDESLTYGIFYNNDLAGIISFNQIDWLNKSAKIGYWVDEKLQGRGLVTQAC